MSVKLLTRQPTSRWGIVCDGCGRTAPREVVTGVFNDHPQPAWQQVSPGWKIHRLGRHEVEHYCPRCQRKGA